MKGYWISLYTKVENQENLKKYAEVVTPIIKSFGGVPLVRGGKNIRSLDSRVKEVKDIDWDTEYLDAIISVKSVSGVDEAIEHISNHGSQHTDSIISSEAGPTKNFLQRVDSGIVMHNTSTQFADGGEFGMGAEIGISTGKLHARGPVGAEQLTTYKYIVKGNGQTRP